MRANKVVSIAMGLTILCCLAAIAIRRIGRSPAAVGVAVTCTALDALNTEHCELLLKFIPTKEEVRRTACGTSAVIYAYQTLKKKAGT